MLFLIIFFGLFYRGCSLTNNVTWLEGRDGIRFGRYGIVYTNTVFPAGTNSPGQDGMTFELVIRPHNFKDDRFKILLSIHGGIDSEQLILGQWRSALIVMNGDDYDGRLGIPKVGVNEAIPPDQDTFVNITSGSEGTQVYINGRLRQSSTRLVLKIPNQDSHAVMVLGNSPYGRHSWAGDIYGMAIYEEILSEEKTITHYNQWSTQQIFSFHRDIQPKVLYLFDDGSGQRVFDHGQSNHHLVIPPRVEILKKEILVAPWNEKQFDHSLIQDMIINLAGFIPPGFFLFAILVNIGGWYKKYGICLTLITCFMVSLTIEILQIWMPSRSSQSLDLIMNAIGGLLGVMLYILSQTMSKRFQNFRRFQ